MCDHAGGLAPVLRKIRVAEFADGGQRYGGHAYQDALATARAQGVPIVYPRASAEWRTDDGVVLHFLGPSLPFIANSRNDINENSVAFILRYRSFCMLFTGDAGAAAEQRFLAEGVDLRCAVLKVGHHGSAYSSTPAFIAAVRPRYAVISVGRHNLFGHPAPSTLVTLQRIGATVLRTDRNGAVTIISDGSNAIVNAALQNEGMRNFAYEPGVFHKPGGRLNHLHCVAYVGPVGCDGSPHGLIKSLSKLNALSLNTASIAPAICADFSPAWPTLVVNALAAVPKIATVPPLPPLATCDLYCVPGGNGFGDANV